MPGLYAAVNCLRCVRGGTSTSRVGGFGVGIISRKLACPSIIHRSLPRLAAGRRGGGTTFQVTFQVSPLDPPFHRMCTHIFSPYPALMSIMARRARCGGCACNHL